MRLWSASILHSDVFLFLGCSHTTIPETSTVGQRLTSVVGNEHWQIYKNSQIGFEIQHPQTWVINSHVGQSLVDFSPPPGEGRGFSITFGVFQPVSDSWIQEPDTLEKWYLRLKKKMLASGEKIVSEEKTSVGGISALKTIFRHTIAKQEELVVNSYIPVPADREKSSPMEYAVHVMQLGGPSNDPEIAKYTAIYDKVLSSLKFLSPAQ